jgi:hypothetical protein
MAYTRYHIHTESCPPVASHPSRFVVKVGKTGLARLLLRELIHYRANLAVVTSRPCLYGTFSGPIGGFAPRPECCVGCLRCTIEHPDFVEVRPNPDRRSLGDSYFTPDKVETILQEASSGQIPVRGAGYRGPFGGQGWDGMWTDMSEIVRPTRDGIHGREFISTVVDLGERPAFLTFGRQDVLTTAMSPDLSLPIPFLFDAPGASVESEALCRALVQAAERLETLAIVPIGRVLDLRLNGPNVVPLVGRTEIGALERLSTLPRMLELNGWDAEVHAAARERFPAAAVFVRLPFEVGILSPLRAGVRLFHLIANYHGKAGGVLAGDAIREAHGLLVKEAVREQAVLIGSGGIITASDVPKAIICGLDAVALDTALLVALQARFDRECVDRQSAGITLPQSSTAWAVQRLMNLIAAWRDQLLEILGAMGLREVRRLRGELGRVMFQADLEREAFAGIAGFEG